MVDAQAAISLPRTFAIVPPRKLLNIAVHFAENIDKFRAAGASVVGMSRDSVESLTRFSIEQCAGKIPVASADQTLVDAFDVNDGAMFNTRTTYVIATSGKIAFVHDSEDSSGHVKSALAFVQGMTK